jgi:hypothetical protein
MSPGPTWYEVGAFLVAQFFREFPSEHEESVSDDLKVSLRIELVPELHNDISLGGGTEGCITL